jgi:ubiquinone/menaquinone biosynthesis C-methylase UbiE
MDAAKFVGTIPENYDQGLGPHIFEGYADDLVQRVAELRPEKTLELAAGTGIVTRKLKDALGEDGDLVATDLNEPMLKVARAKFENTDGVSFEQADAMNLPYPDSAFDVVACQFGVMFFPDIPGSYREAKRVLRSGGSYVFNVWGSWAANPFAQIAHETVAEFFPEHPPGFYKVPFGYHDTAEIQNALQGAGFDRVSIDEVNLTSSISSPEAFARGLVFGNPLFQEVTDRGGDPDEVCAAVSDAIDRHLGAQMPLQAFVISAFNP